jgi:phospholipid transport system substrate-binding protein
MHAALAFNLAVATVVLAPVAVAAAADAAAQQGPKELVEGVAKDLLRDLDKNREQLRKDPSQVRKLVDQHLLPHFDTEYAARLVLAKHWRDASAEQRKKFVDAFYQSLIQNYGAALVDFTPDRLTVLPYNGDPSEQNATVRTTIKRDNGSSIPVNYSLHKTPEGWKAWDVTIEGVSYVRSFRTDFGTEIDQKGLDAVINRLQAHPDAPPTAKSG